VRDDEDWIPVMPVSAAMAVAAAVLTAILFHDTMPLRRRFACDR